MLKKLSFFLLSLILVHQSALGAVETLDKVLMRAVDSKQLEQIKSLIKSQANVNFIDENGSSPLTLAAYNQSCSDHSTEVRESFKFIANILIEAGALYTHKDSSHNNRTAEEILGALDYCHYSQRFLRAVALKQELTSLFIESTLLDDVEEYLFNLEIDDLIVKKSWNPLLTDLPIAALTIKQKDNKCCLIN